MVGQAPLYGQLHGRAGHGGYVKKQTCYAGNGENIRSYLASWQGGVHTTLELRPDGVAWLRVETTEHQGNGVRRLLYEGPVGEEPSGE